MNTFPVSFRAVRFRMRLLRAIDEFSFEIRLEKVNSTSLPNHLAGSLPNFRVYFGVSRYSQLCAGVTGKAQKEV
jgi:hypothetical protein